MVKHKLFRKCRIISCFDSLLGSVSDSAKAVRKFVSKLLCFLMKPEISECTVRQKCNLASAKSKGYVRIVVLHCVFPRTQALYFWKQWKRLNIAEHTVRDFLVFPRPICGSCQSCGHAAAHYDSKYTTFHGDFETPERRSAQYVRKKAIHPAGPNQNQPKHRTDRISGTMGSIYI